VTEHDARTLPAALCALITCAWAAPSGRWGWAVALWVGVAALSALCVRRWGDIVRAVSVAAAVTAVIALVGLIRSLVAFAPEVDAAIGAQAAVSVEGTVVGQPRPVSANSFTGEQRVMVRVRLSSACAQPCEHRLTAHGDADLALASTDIPTVGEGVVATGTAGTSRDARAFMVVWDAQWEPTTRHDALLTWIAGVRERTRSHATGLNTQVRPLVLGMVLGDTRDLPPDLQHAMQVTSLTHLTAVSGSHFAIVTLAVGALIRRLVRWRAVRSIILATVMGLLSVLVGPEPSVLRALTMAVAVAAGIAWGRPSQALPALGTGVLALLAIEPALGASIGLQLSALAVVAIVVWAPHLRRILARWVIPAAATAISVPTAAWLACWPLLVDLSPGLGPYAVPANLIAGVAAFPVTVLGLAGVVLGGVWAGAQVGLLTAASWCAWPVVWAARVFAAAPGAWLAWPHGVTGVVLASAVVALLAWGTMARGAAPAVRVAAAVVAVVVQIGSPMLSAHVAVAKDAAIVVCDVGQGDMSMILAGNGSAIVIDTGPAGGGGAQCARRYGVHHVALLVLTHPHADHDGGLAELKRVASIDQIWVSPAALDPANDVAASMARQWGITVRVPQAGDRFEAGRAQVVVLAAGNSSRGASPGSTDADADLNDASLAVWARSGPASGLFLADLQTAGQDALAAVIARGVIVDVVKVAHHGSRVQSQRLADLVTARVAAISVGATNPYGHPNLATISMYRTRAGVVMTTARCGDIVITSHQQVAARCQSGVAG